MTVSRDDVRRYWNERAQEAAGAPQATTDDVWLRHLEVAKLIDEVRRLRPAPGTEIADLGCGDGRTALALAAGVPDVRVVGIDFSPSMIEVAGRLQREAAADDASVADRVRFMEGDVMALEDALGKSRFEIVITDRCLINLPSWDEQQRAVRSIAQHTRPGGTYLAVENFVDGQDAMNALRTEIGLPAIPVRWHNVFLDEPTFLAEAATWFDPVEVEDFTSTYYLVTRVVYSSLCARKGIEPDYNHPIHELAAKLGPVGRFSPIRFVRMRRRA